MNVSVFLLLLDLTSKAMCANRLKELETWIDRDKRVRNRTVRTGFRKATQSGFFWAQANSRPLQQHHLFGGVALDVQSLKKCLELIKLLRR